MGKDGVACFANNLYSAMYNNNKKIIIKIQWCWQNLHVQVTNYWSKDVVRKTHWRTHTHTQTHTCLGMLTEIYIVDRFAYSNIYLQRASLTQTHSGAPFLHKYTQVCLATYKYAICSFIARAETVILLTTLWKLRAWRACFLVYHRFK